MNKSTLLIVFALSLYSVSPLATQAADAQEKRSEAPSISQDQPTSNIISAFWAPSKNPLPTIMPKLAWQLRRFVNTIDLQIRKSKSFRMLAFPVMDLWVDEYDQLINEHNNVIGKWGVDAPATPMHSIPKLRR